MLNEIMCKRIESYVSYNFYIKFIFHSSLSVTQHIHKVTDRNTSYTSPFAKYNVIKLILNGRVTTNSVPAPM